MDIIEELRAYRLENRISQQQLAGMLRVSYPTVNRWFNHKYKPSEIQAHHIRKLLNESKKD